MPNSLPKQQKFAVAVKEKRMYSPRYSTQEQMAEHLELSLNEYKKIEKGHIPKTGLFLRICRKLDLDPMEYLDDALLKGQLGKEKQTKELEGAL